MQTRWIDQPGRLRKLCDDVAGDPIAVDTESDHFHAYQARVCLIQVGTREVGALVDPLALSGAELAPLFELLADADVRTLLHSGRNDIRELDRDYDVGVAGMFDTQIAAKFLGYPRNALSWLQEEIVGDTPSGQYQRFDWTTRPIPGAAREYAVADVADLFVLRDHFLPELERSGWLEPFRQQCAYIAAISGYEWSPFDPDGWRRYAGRGNLDGRGRATLRELFAARHQICSDLNRAALHVFPNEAMVEVAEVQPTRPRQLSAIDRLPDDTISAYADDILGAVERAANAAVPPKSKPRGSRDRPSKRQRRIHRALKRWRNRTADSIDVSGEFIATNATLSKVAADPPESVDGLDAFGAILPWHRQMFGDQILETIDRAR